MEKEKLKRTVSGILVSSVLAVTMLTPQVSAETVGGSLDNFKPGTAKEFSDVVSTDWYYGNTADAAALGIIQGNPDGTYCFDCNGLKPFDEFKAEVAKKGADVSKLEVYLWSVPDEYIKKQ